MIQKTIHEIGNMLGAKIINCVDASKKIHGVSIDSRTLTQDMLYIPMLGQKVDGHSFIDSAIEKGIGASFWQIDHTPYPTNVPLILVEDCQVALQALAREYMKTLSCLVIGITGSNGKTSCKDMMYSVFSQEKKTQKTLGNRNNEIGLPLTILDLEEDVEVAILEMGMENFHEIQELCEIASPDISIITSIGSAHMENLGNKLGIAKAKLEILEYSKPGSLFLYNKDCPEIDECLGSMDQANHKIVSFGKGADITIDSSIQVWDTGIQFTCSELEKPVFLKAFGDFQAMNSLPVIYAAKMVGLKDESILKGLAELEMTKMRTQLISLEHAKILDDSYKSNPESAKAALDALMSIPAKIHIALLSDMLDLGSEEHILHASVGEYACQVGVDQVFCVGELSKDTAKAANDKGKWFASKEELVKACQEYLNEDCIILVKGSRAMTMDTVVDMLRG